MYDEPEFEEPEDFENAEKMYKMAIDFDPEYAPVYRGLAEVYWIFGWKKAESEQDKKYYSAQEEKLIAKANQIEPYSAETNINLGYQFQGRGDFEKAYGIIVDFYWLFVGLSRL